MKKVKDSAKWTWSALRPGAIIGFRLVSLRHSIALRLDASITHHIDAAVMT